MSTLVWDELDNQAVATAKALAADAVQKVGNGHPGTAISMAPAAYLLYQKVMRYDPADPSWLGRDKFILSMGHSSLTQYVQLYLAGAGLELEDLQSLRTWGALTPGHPEVGHTKGVEITTGPLGQGLASAVGMCMSNRRVRGLLDPDTPQGQSPFDHFVYVFAGDGCLQEGVTAEACSLAGTQELGNLILIYDDNHITIEDDTKIAFTEEVLARYQSYGWHTQSVSFVKDDGSYQEDLDGLWQAIAAAQAETNKPSIISLRTIIGWPTPNLQNTGAIHGSALGADNLAGLKEALGLDPEASFAVADEVIAHTRQQATARAGEARAQWDALYADWAEDNPEGVSLLNRLVKRELPAGWEASLPSFGTGKAVSTRAASGAVLNAIAHALPELWGGSADLAGSNNTYIKGEASFLPKSRSSEAFAGNEYGRNLHFGVREHAMGAILNGMALDGFTRPYGGTFLVFSDYMRGAVRLAAVMNTPSIFVWSHDSIGVGEDGPTHQPVEHLTALRAIPNLAVIRPADAAETAQAWKAILEKDNGPMALILSRQNLPDPVRLGADGGCCGGGCGGNALPSAEGVARGAYILLDCLGTPDVILMATGSEVALALGAAEVLQGEGKQVRVVSVPCQEWFAEQSAEYQESVFPAAVKARVSVEAGLAMSWHKLVGSAGACVSIEHFGASAAADKLFAEYGFTVDNVVATARKVMA